MEIARVIINGNEARAIDTKRITKGMRGATIRVTYADPMWDSLTKLVVFEGATEAGFLHEGEIVEVPPEVLAESGGILRFGVCGKDADGAVVIPTLWAELGQILSGVPTNINPPSGASPSLWMQILGMIGDLMALETETRDNLVASINEVLAKTGTGGTSDAVQYIEQALNEDQQMQARANLGLYGYRMENRKYADLGPDSNGVVWDCTNSFQKEPSDAAVVVEIYDTEPYTLRHKGVYNYNGRSSESASGGNDIREYWGNLALIQNDQEVWHLFEGRKNEYPDAPCVLYRVAHDDYGIDYSWRFYISQDLAPSYWLGFRAYICTEEKIQVAHTVPAEFLPPMDAAAGGYYIPSIQKLDESTAEFTFTPSADGMAYVEPVQVTLPAGPAGPQGEKGDTGAQGPAGPDGVPGRTPVKGEDYWTQADQDEIYNYIATELAKRGQLRPEPAESLEWLAENGDTSKVYVLPSGSLCMWLLTEKEVETGPGYTNLLPAATDTDGTIYGGDYNGDGVNDGYKTATRLSGSSGSPASSSASMCTSGFIPAKDGDVVRIKGAYAVAGVSPYVISYDSSNAKIAYKGIEQTSNLLWSTTGTWFSVDQADDNLLTLTLSSDNFGTGIAAIRFNADMTSGNVIVTVNEEIVEGSTEIVEEYAWTSTGHAFIPADYEPRIIDLEEQVAENTTDIAALKKGSVDTGGVDALTWIRNWDGPIYDRSPVFQLDHENPALSASDKTVASIYEKYDALAAANPRYITKTDLGACSDGVTHVYRYDFREPEPHHQSGQQWSETKPVVICASGIHWEWGGVYSLYYALKEITENPELDNLRRNVHFVVVPVINPYCFTDIGPYSETYGVLNANGVQIHRNFEVGFIYPGQSGYSELGQRNHGGTEPLSEIETQNIDSIFKQYPDAALFMTCHSAQRDTRWGTGFIWASTATNYTCNLGYRLVDKLSKAWHAKYGTAWESGCTRENEFVLADPATYPNAVELEPGDYRAGHAHVSATDGTETRQATKYGIQGANVEVLDTFWVLDSTGLGSKVTTHGAEVYINYLLMYMGCYDHKDKKQYYIQ